MRKLIARIAHAVARVHDVASARGGVLKGIPPQGERRSVACFDDLEDVR
jgi:hypothetical protein